MQAEATFRSGPEDGLYEVVLHAARATSRETQGAVGVVEIVAVDQDLELEIETEFAHQDGRRVVDDLVVRVRKPLDADLDAGRLVRAGLSTFGSAAFTSVTADGGEGVDPLDVTLSFGGVVPWWSLQLVLPLTDVPAEALATYSGVLSALGVRHRQGHGTLRVPRHQLRGRPSTEEQATAYDRARQAGGTACLYASALPARQAFRVEESGARGARVVDVTLSRGLSESYVCSSADAAAMQLFFSSHLGVRFSGVEYRAVNHFGAASQAERQPVFAGSSRGSKRGRKPAALKLQASRHG